ncbi:hypothetical protein [Paludisphaera mucosa]|uniref:Twin-arginine translocation signal domain-containing protein n=1 Tax=Paludisphaera mucosa TaxID=3030827 RepID=A0ABT6FH94_9BACT|nr:hypothetical protein [Paludisphaera mucosa]MDG3006942.1 hypothetical protein [Paludisphaera mucosa]
MNRRYFLTGLGVVLGAGCLTLAGCGTAVDSNVPEEKLATKESSEDMKKAIDAGLKGMGKTPK